MSCGCDAISEAIQQALGVAGRLIVARCRSNAVPSLDSGGGGGVPRRLEKCPCPPQCTQEKCDAIFDFWSELFIACGGNLACETDIQVLYEYALSQCG